MDSVLGGYNKKVNNPPTTPEKVEALIVDAFNAAAEMDIKTGFYDELSFNYLFIGD